MGYRSREKKRAIKASQLGTRSVQAPRWYLTIVGRGCSCNSCAKFLKRGSELVYRYEPRTVLCLLCAESQGIKARPSVAWEKWRLLQRREKGVA